MRKAIMVLMLTVVSLFASVTIGVDSGKYEAGKSAFYAEQLKVGYEYRGFNFYVYGQNDTLKENGVSVDETSYGTGVDFTIGYFTAGTSYGRGDLAGFDYDDFTAKAGLKYQVDNMYVEAGIKSKRLEIVNTHDNFHGGYFGVGYGF